MQALAFRQEWQTRNIFKRNTLGKIEPFGVTQTPAHKIVERDLCNINKHETRQNFRGPNFDAQECGDHCIEHASQDARNQHSRQNPIAAQSVIHAMRHNGNCPAHETTNDKLTFRANIPEIGAITKGEARGDENER